MAHIIHDVYFNEKLFWRFGGTLPNHYSRPLFFVWAGLVFTGQSPYKDGAHNVLFLKKPRFLYALCLAGLGNCAKTWCLSRHFISMILCLFHKVYPHCINDGESITLTLHIFEYSFEGKTSPHRLKWAGGLYAF